MKSLKLSNLLSLRGAFAVLVGMVIVLTGAGSASAWRFGTECQEGYQNGWQHTLPWAWETCSRFNNELDDTDSKVYYYNLRGARSWWENTNDQNGMERVNLLFANTHGGAWYYDAVWCMWDQGQYARSRNMRLGDESIGLSILATYACKTVKFSDGRFWARHHRIFRGGLRYMCGSHDTLWSSITTDECGEDFADNLQRGHTIKSAWKNGLSDWYHDQDVAVATVGTNYWDCVNRRDGMTWRNFNSFPRLRDGAIGYWCGYYWSNL